MAVGSSRCSSYWVGPGLLCDADAQRNNSEVVMLTQLVAGLVAVRSF